MQCCGFLMVGEQSMLICSALSPLFSFPRKTRNGNCESFQKKIEMRGKVNPKIRVVVVEGAFPHIGARGCIIISKLSIYL